MSSTDDPDPSRPNPPPARARPRTPVSAAPPAGASEDQAGDGSSDAASSGEVGYGKPPRRSQFQPGHSGNPKGRPKGSISLSTLIGQELDKKVTAKMGGKSVSMTRREAMVHRVIEKAMLGDLKAFVVLLKLDPTAGVLDAPLNQPETPLGPDEAQILRAFLSRVASVETGGQTAIVAAAHASWAAARNRGGWAGGSDGLGVEGVVDGGVNGEEPLG